MQPPVRHHTEISTVRGPVNPGGGDIIYYDYRTLVENVAKGRSRTYSLDELVRLDRYFVSPRGFGEAREKLETHRIVFLDGTPGSGRTAAVKMLLYRIPGSGKRFRELPWREDGDESNPDDERVEDGDRIWQDLSWVGDGAWEDAQKDLSALCEKISGRDAYLAVVLPQVLIRKLRGELADYRVVIERPPAMEVLRRYLRLRGVPGAATALLGPKLTDYLSQAPAMREIAHLGELIVEAWRSSEGSDFSAWCETALETLEGRDSTVIGKIGELHERQGMERALLLATAMLHGAHADQIHRAAAKLLSTVRHPEDDRPLLERSNHAERFKRIDAEMNSEGYVHFKKLRWSSAVPVHFWRHMPELRDGIQKWVEEIGDWAELREEERDSVIDTFTDLCLNDRHRERIALLVLRWTGGKVTNRRLRAAYLALKRGLEAEEHGRFFRRQIYEWSRGKELPSGGTRLPDALAQVIILACVEVIAVHHPEQAVVRLHHCARQAQQSASAACDALLQLVSGDTRLRRYMLTRLTRLPGSGRWPIDDRLFLDIADPVAFTDPGDRSRPLLDENTVPDMLTDGWRRVFTRHGVETWGARMREWLRRAAEDERNREALLDPLLVGAKEQASVFGHIFNEAHRLSRDPAAENGERHAAFRDLVFRKICTVQGLRLAWSIP